MVGIIGGGVAGLYAGLMLQSIGVEFELFEKSTRVGGRLKTWYSEDYDENDTDKKGLYGEIGGMRLPQFSSRHVIGSAFIASLKCCFRQKRFD